MPTPVFVDFGFAAVGGERGDEWERHAGFSENAVPDSSDPAASLQVSRMLDAAELLEGVALKVRPTTLRQNRTRTGNSQYQMMRQNRQPSGPISADRGPH